MLVFFISKYQVTTIVVCANEIPYWHFSGEKNVMSFLVQIEMPIFCTIKLFAHILFNPANCFFFL